MNKRYVSTYYFMPDGRSLHSSVPRLVYRNTLTGLDKGELLEDALKHAQEVSYKGRAANNLKYKMPSGESMRSYCKKIGVRYQSVVNRIRDYKQNYMDALNDQIKHEGVDNVPSHS